MQCTQHEHLSITWIIYLKYKGIVWGYYLICLCSAPQQRTEKHPVLSLGLHHPYSVLEGERYVCLAVEQLSRPVKLVIR